VEGNNAKFFGLIFDLLEHWSTQ